MGADVYRLAISRINRTLVFVLMVVLSVAVGVFVVTAVRRADAAFVPIVVFWLAALGWNWYVLFTLPYEIRFDSVDRIAFVSLSGRVTLAAADIRSIKPYAGSFYVLLTARGRSDYWPGLPDSTRWLRASRRPTLGWNWWVSDRARDEQVSLCAEDIQDHAIECTYRGSMLDGCSREQTAGRNGSRWKRAPELRAARARPES